MPLKAVVDAIDSVDEALRPFYEEQNGVFVLSLEEIEKHPSTQPVQNALRNAKQERDAVRQEAASLKTRLSELESKPNPTAKDDAEMIRLREALEAERDEWKGKAANLEKQVFGLTVENGLEAVLSEVGVSDPSLRKAAKRLLLDDAKVIDGKAVVETDMGPLGLADHVKRWAAGEGKSFVTRPAGGGANGNDGGTNAKTMKRSDFEALSPEQKHAAIKDGAAITD